ncbi:MAG TPA: ABC transporter permease [Acidimicrobiia bacterium]|nr:ABC transporter permease [Acidimicrobiia bacterium]
MSAPVLTTRVLPPIRRPGTRAQRIIERNLMVYRRIWLVIFSGFFEPVFYLLSIGLGVGMLVGDISLADGRLVSYTSFVAPALLASSAMNGAVFESTLNLFFKLKWGKVYDAVLTTPMQPLDIALGEAAWSLTRGGMYSLAFVVVMAVFGLVNSWWALAAVPACLLIGFAFAGMGMAATTFMKGWQDFDLVQLVVQPLFLFSGTFFPIDVYPPALQLAARFSPLYHGTELVRAATLGHFDWSVPGHILFLLVMGLLGMAITRRRFAKLLLP